MTHRIERTDPAEPPDIAAAASDRDPARVLFIGTGGGIPTPHRGLPAAIVENSQGRVLVDCGEGTQNRLIQEQMLGGLCSVLVTHLHADHCTGIPGLIRSLDLLGRTEPLTVYGPIGIAEFLAPMRRRWAASAFELQVVELEPGACFTTSGWEVEPFAALHRGAALGYAFRERGGGRTIVFSGDTAPCEELVELASGADLLVHEATFLGRDEELAQSTGHSTVEQAVEQAARAGARLLVLNHLGYHVDDREFLLEAAGHQPMPVVARDLDVLEIPESGAPPMLTPAAAPLSAKVSAA